MTSIMSVNVDVKSLGELFNVLEYTVEKGSPTLFVGLYPALARIIRREPEYLEILRNACVYPDGMGVVWALRLMNDQVPARMATTDIVWDVLRLAEEKRWRVMLYGGRPEVVQRVSAKLQGYFPSLHIVAVRHGFEDIDIDVLRTASPDVLFVARGAPLQELWSQHTAIPAGIPATFTCGGLFDFIAGEVSRAPGWVTLLGLEWAFRVLQEPKRLFWRYAVGNTLFVLWVLRDTVLRRRSTRD